MREERKGEIFAVGNTLIWGAFPVIAVLSYAAVPALTSLAWSTLFAAVFFAALVSYRGTWKEMAQPLLWKYMAFVVVLLSIVFYALYFIGLETTTPGNAAILMLLEVGTSFVLFHMIRKEPISAEHRLGALLMVIGAAVILVPNYAGVRVGDFLILVAVCCAPLGNLFQQKARAIASAETIMFMRTACATPFVFALAYFLNAHASVGEVQKALPLLLINGIVVLGLSKIFWIESIHRLSVTKAVAFESFAPLVTLGLAWLFLSQAPSLFQLLSLPILVVGTLFITEQLRLRTRSP